MSQRADVRICGAQVATMRGEGLGLLIADVCIRGDRVAYIGPPKDAPKANVRVDAEGMTLLPGLVDPHTHLVFAGERIDELDARLRGADYIALGEEGGGIASTVRATRGASDAHLWSLALRRARALRACGVTTVEVKSGYGLQTEQELRLLRIARRLDAEGVIRVRTSFLGAHAVPPERAGERTRYVDEVVQEQLPAVVQDGLADACDVYLDEGAFTREEARRILVAAKDAGLAVRAHVGQFADLGGPELLAELGGLSVDHLEHASDAGVAALAGASVTAVLLPGAWRTLRQAPPDAMRLRNAGVRVAVGTDLNPGTSPTSDLPLMAALAARDAGLGMVDAIRAITVEAAGALGVQAGVINEGAVADLALFACPHPLALAYSMGGLRPHRVWIGGRLVEASDRSASAIW